MAYTALNLITDVLLDMGVLADQETPTASQSVGALTKLNDLIESWNLDPQKLYGSTEYILPFVANKATYTIGLGGDLNVARPDMISQAFVRNTTATPSQQQDIPITVLTPEQWAEIPVKGQIGTYPYAVWFNMTNPLITAFVTPISTGSNYSLVFWDSNAIALLNLNTVLILPPGYKRALKYALWVELADGYQLEVSANTERKANSAKASIDRQNLIINQLNTSNNSSYNIFSNTYRVY